MKKKRLIVVLLVAFLAVTLSGCNSKLSITQTGSTAKISCKGASSGSMIDSQEYSVGKDRVVTIESSLDSGSLQIEFVQIYIPYSEDNDDNWVELGTVATVTVGPGAKENVELPADDYILRVTTIGETTGTVKVSVNKK